MRTRPLRPGSDDAARERGCMQRPVAEMTHQTRPPSFVYRSVWPLSPIRASVHIRL